MLTKTESHFGDMPVAAINDPRVRKEFLEWRDKVARTSGEREADHRLSAMFSWAMDRGLLTHNHIRGFRRLYHSDRAELIWLPEHITRFMEVAPLEMQRALIIALHTGQRQGDIPRLPWSSYDGCTIKLKQGKATRRGVKPATVDVRCTKALKRLLDSLPRESQLILTTKTGQAFKKRWFASLWKSAMVDAGIEALHFNDLRGTAITMLSEAGNTVPQIAAVTGHSLRSVTTILENYLARTRHLSDAAIENFENSKRTKFANRLQTKPPSTKSRTKKLGQTMV
jgi:integrase